MSEGLGASSIHTHTHTYQSQTTPCVLTHVSTPILLLTTSKLWHTKTLWSKEKPDNQTAPGKHRWEKQLPFMCNLIADVPGGRADWDGSSVALLFAWKRYCLGKVLLHGFHFSWGCRDIKGQMSRQFMLNSITFDNWLIKLLTAYVNKIMAEMIRKRLCWLSSCINCLHSHAKKTEYEFKRISFRGSRAVRMHLVTSIIWLMLCMTYCNSTMSLNERFLHHRGGCWKSWVRHKAQRLNWAATAAQCICKCPVHGSGG